MDNVLPVLDTSRSFPGSYRERIFRAKFSSLSASDLHRAMANLSVPSENEAHSVDARAEIDLRLGIAFSRFLTQYFHKQFGEQMMKTMHDDSFVVHEHSFRQKLLQTYKSLFQLNIKLFSKLA